MTASRGDSKPLHGCRLPGHDAGRPTERQLRANACDVPSRGRSGYGDGTQSLGVQRRHEPLSPGMKDLTLPQPSCSEAAYRHLAVRVIQQAVRDLSGAAASPAEQESARTFLSGSPMFYRWCEFANLNAARTVARATKLMAGRLAIRTRIQDHASAPR